MPPQTELRLALAVGILLGLSLLAGVENKHLRERKELGGENEAEFLLHWLVSWSQ